MDTPRPDRTKAKTGLSHGKKVRVIAKVRGFTDLEAESSNCVSVHKPNGVESETVSISFGDQSGSRKESYELDYCYEQSEGNYTIFTREVKPLIAGVFYGCNATIIANGARGSGKTHMIQGSDKDPGLAVLAMAEILSIVGETGKSITISFYEIFQAHVYDLLDPKRQEVLALENRQGKILLKGLSQVPVNSISEFQKLYLIEHKSRKPVQKIPIEFPRRSHRGLIIHVSSPSDAIPMGKMNFVDLAGYEDTRRKSSEGLNLVEKTKVNRSIYALHNVVYALNTSECHVPYRESKLTRMLQDSLGGKSRVLMLTCLNPTFCQDSMYMVSLASRSRQGINQTVLDSIKKAKSSARPMPHSSHKSQLPGSVSTTRKQIGNRLHFSVKKANGTASVTKGRKLFDEASHLTNSEKKIYEKESSVSVALPDRDSTSMVEKDASPLATTNPQETTIIDKESSISAALPDKDSTSVVEKDASPLATTNPQETTIIDKDSFQHIEGNYGEVTPSINCNLKTPSFLEESGNLDKENDDSQVNKDGSPLISERLQQISNNLKLLISSTPQHLEMPLRNDTSSIFQSCTDFVEPKTPERSVTVNDKWETENINSPWETISMHSSIMKDSLVKEYLKILNTGSREDLIKLKGIKQKRATRILKLREKSPEPFKNLDGLKDVGLSAKQIKGMMSKGIEELF
ncbi:kinesin-like protein KIN-10C isoform X1 [Pistacia vera]|uniref:kinesin-like protein KIN-10C isoform X1 n=1 Tax=Pistacia vera TaxID=55513 RepID=UPI001262E64B|nr:kinesin-like protein KIN-10C isoform X1 [Pistacia vera]